VFVRKYFDSQHDLFSFFLLQFFHLNENNNAPNSLPDLIITSFFYGITISRFSI
jgi:hypothetical protein